MRDVENPRTIYAVVPLFVPYVRVGRERFTKRATRYHASRDDLMKRLRIAEMQCRTRQRGTPTIARPYVVSVQVYVHPKKGGLTARATGGDWDNYLKAALDAAVREGIVAGDGPNLFRGVDWTHSSGITARSDWEPHARIVIRELTEGDPIALVSDADLRAAGILPTDSPVYRARVAAERAAKRARRKPSVPRTKAKA